MRTSITQRIKDATADIKARSRKSVAHYKDRMKSTKWGHAITTVVAGGAAGVAESQMPTAGIAPLVAGIVGTVIGTTGNPTGFRGYVGAAGEGLAAGGAALLGNELLREEDKVK